MKSFKCNFYFSFLFMLFLSCKIKNEVKMEDIYDADELIYYFFDKNISQIEYGTNHISINYQFEIDNYLEDDLLKVGFKEKKIKKKLYIEIFKIFKDFKELQDDDAITGAIPYFKNIIVFKKDSCVIGLARIDFPSRKVAILTKNKNIYGYDFSINYLKLENILSE